MLRKILLAGAALATLALPVAANAQRYSRSYGTYGHGRHYYWDGHHYRDRDNNAILDAVIAGLLGYAVGSLGSSYYGYSYPTNRYPSYGYSYPSYGYSYPSYGYSSPYGSPYGSYYSYPSTGYSYQYSYPSYGYSPYHW